MKLQYRCVLILYLLLSIKKLVKNPFYQYKFSYWIYLLHFMKKFYQKFLKKYRI